MILVKNKSRAILKNKKKVIIYVVYGVSNFVDNYLCCTEVFSLHHLYKNLQLKHVKSFVTVIYL